MAAYLGVDVGGTAVKLGLCDSFGAVLARAQVPTPGTGAGGLQPQQLAATIADFASGQGLELAQVGRVGVGVPGVVHGGAVWAPNLGWNGLEVEAALRAHLGIPVLLENDANAAAWAEHLVGAGHGQQDLVLLTLGTGVGCGIISGGRILRGAHGQAGELGHITVIHGGDPCNCGKRGCLETRSGTAALWRRAGLEGTPDIRRVFALAGSGEPMALAAVEEFIAYLGVALSTVVALLDPPLILIGGGIAQAGEKLLADLGAAMRTELGHQLRVHPAIRLAQLGNDAGMIGAALLHP